jgi:hypothetical protein
MTFKKYYNIIFITLAAFTLSPLMLFCKYMDWVTDNSWSDTIREIKEK